MPDLAAHLALLNLPKAALMVFLFSALVMFVPEAPETHSMDVPAATSAIMMNTGLPYVWDEGDCRLSVSTLLSGQVDQEGLPASLLSGNATLIAAVIGIKSRRLLLAS